MTRYRVGTPADTATCYAILEAAVDDLVVRQGGEQRSMSGDPAAGEMRGPLMAHLAATADEWWIAEDETTGRAVGYARSIMRDGVRELTEFFVHPAAQTGGIGRELIGRAFPAHGARHRAIVATVDPRALASYLRTGLDPKVTMAGLSGTPRDEPLATDLAREAIVAGDPPLEALGLIDREILGFRRDEEHRYLSLDRPGWLYRRGGRPVGYGYHPPRPSWGGPYAVLTSTDLPALLADGEATAAAAGHASATFDLPLIARPAVDHLLGRGYRVDPFLMQFFTDGPVAGLDRYVLTTPPFFA